MTEYEIVCADRSEVLGRHRHVTAVGLAGPGNLVTGWTVEGVLHRYANGDRFYISVDGDPAFVHPYRCGCGYETIRTTPDDETIDVLDGLHGCG
jgi:hypothetical protein